MRIVNSEISLESFFIKLNSAKFRILMLDYDGTLSPFTTDRDNAAPYQGVTEILDNIMSIGGTRLIIISGRPVAVLKELLDLKNQPEMWGCHGAERLLGNGDYSSTSIPDSVKNLYASIESWADGSGFSKNLEKKPFGLAFHWRGAAPKRQKEIESAVRLSWEKKIENEGLELKEFDGGLEIRMRDINKSNAVKSILSEYSDDYMAAYLGDDLTDEDAFKALGNRGLKVLVRRETRPTAADIILLPPEELLQFLANWLENSGSGC